jgi:hypothetical protein
MPMSGFDWFDQMMGFDDVSNDLASGLAASSSVNKETTPSAAHALTEGEEEPSGRDPTLTAEGAQRSPKGKAPDIPPGNTATETLPDSVERASLSPSDFDSEDEPLDRDLTANLARIKSCLDSNNLKVGMSLIGKLLNQVALPMSRQSLDYETAAVFGNRLFQFPELVAEFEAAIQRRITELGRHHTWTAQLRTAFVHLILGILQEDSDEKQWDQDKAGEILERSHQHLNEIFAPRFTGDVLEQLVPPFDEPLDWDDREGLEVLFSDYSFVETFVTACAEYPHLVPALLCCHRYQELLAGYDVVKAARKLVEMGLVEETRVLLPDPSFLPSTLT